MSESQSFKPQNEKQNKQDEMFRDLFTYNDKKSNV